MKAPEDPWVTQERDISGVSSIAAGLHDLLAIWEQSGDGPHKVLGMGAPPRLGGWLKTLGALPTGFEVNVSRSKSTYLEIVSREVNKGWAVQRTAALLGGPRRNCGGWRRR